MLSRVVPGWSKAMTRSSPSSVLTRVDLPTLGRPTIAIFGTPVSVADGSSSAWKARERHFDQVAHALAMRRRNR